MTPKNPHLPASKEALFRYRVVAAVLARVAAGWVRAEAVREAAAQLHLGVDGALRQVSVYRWLLAWDRGGMVGLESHSRRRTQTSEVLPEALLEFLAAEHLRDPAASIPEVLRRARQLGVIAPGDRVCRSTVWRAARRMSLDFRRRKKGRDRDSRRFRVESRMQLVLADGKHFRAGVARLRRVALFFLHNASRVLASIFPKTKDAKRGRTIDGWQVELFATDLPADAWPAADTVTAYFGRNSLENRFAQEDRETKLDRVLSYEHAGSRPAR